jgi:hypothetical protein
MKRKVFSTIGASGGDLDHSQRSKLLRNFPATSFSSFNHGRL